MFSNCVLNPQRSIEDEINRESFSEVTTIAGSYILMFGYVAIALGKFPYHRMHRIFVSLSPFHLLILVIKSRALRKANLMTVLTKNPIERRQGGSFRF